MNKLFYTLLWCLMALSVTAQHKHTPVIKSECHQFVNDINRTDCLQPIYMLRSNHAKELRELLPMVLADTIFSQKDKDCFVEQLKALNHFKWSMRQINHAKGISNRALSRLYRKKSHWDAFQKKHSESIVGYSMPLFTREKSMALVYRATYCGSLCGGGALMLYKKILGKWMYVKDYGHWIG